MGSMSQGQIVAVISAVALIASVFLTWADLGGDIPDIAVPEGAPPGVAEAAETAQDEATSSGWDFQRVLSIYLLIVAGLVVGNFFMSRSGRPEGIPFAPPAATFLLGAIGSILTVYVLLDMSPVDPGIGLFVAIAAVLGVAIGSFLQLREEVAEAY